MQGPVRPASRARAASSRGGALALSLLMSVPLTGDRMLSGRAGPRTDLPLLVLHTTLKSLRNLR